MEYPCQAGVTIAFSGLEKHHGTQIPRNGFGAVDRSVINNDNLRNQWAGDCLDDQTNG
jgi:hypothetical protein